MKRQNRLLYLWVLLLLASCSTTSRLGSDELLYTGIKEIKVEEAAGVTLSPSAESAAKKILLVKPNNALFSPYVRTPFPIGLWVYNHWQPKRKSGLGYWIYEKLVERPILISGVQPQLRTEVATDILHNHGYFDSKVTAELQPNKRNPKKTKLSYTIQLNASPLRYSSVRFPLLPYPLAEQIDTLQRNSLLQVGGVYNTDTLEAERNRIARVLRNEGYYYFRPDYLEYLADTTAGDGTLALRMVLKKGVKEAALQPYSTGKIALDIASATDQGEWVKEPLPHFTLNYQHPMRLRRNMVEQAITLREGTPYQLKQQEVSLNRLNGLGLFRSLNLALTPLDSLTRGDSIDVAFKAQLNYPLDAQFGVSVVSKSNSYLGPGVDFTLKQTNLWGGAEVLALQLHGAYEWQTGGQRVGEKQSLINSYEFGISSSLTLPRLVVPPFMQPKVNYPQRTKFEIGGDLMNRPSYFRLMSFHALADYTFQSSPVSYHTFTPLNMIYSRLLNTTAAFDSTLQQNPAIAQSFATNFTPAMSYTYRYERERTPSMQHYMVWEAMLMQAGNLSVGIASLAGVEGEKRLLGTPISQFVKGTTQLIYYHKLGGNQWLASRLMVGAAHAYGNSSVVPYSEQFYIGGANSIRAFTVRSLGPGSYYPSATQVDGYLDQTGDFKLEANVEYRFPIAGALHGALFVDAGNVWLLKPDPKRPGGALSSAHFWNDIALGSGAGLRFDIGYIVLRGDLGVGIHTPYPNPDKSTYYNMSSFKRSLAFHLAIGYPF